jgi:TolB-like protein
MISLRSIVLGGEEFTMRPRNTFTRIPLALALMALASCAHDSHKYHDLNMDFGSVKTVAVLPFQNLSKEQAAGDRVRDVFSNALLASGSVYVVPPGEVARVLMRSAVVNPAAPSVDEVVKVGGLLKADAVITGLVKEYGEVRSSGGATGNILSISMQMIEASTGKVVWAASTTKGGISMMDRLLGSGGAPMDGVTEQAVDDLLNQLFK